MCKGYVGAECSTPACRRRADCRYDPFCKSCRSYWYDNEDREGDGRGMDC